MFVWFDRLTTNGFRKFSVRPELVEGNEWIIFFPIYEYFSYFYVCSIQKMLHQFKEHSHDATKEHNEIN